MKESEFAQRAMAEKERLYRTALIYLGGEAAALDAVDEAVYRGLLACGRLPCSVWSCVRRCDHGPEARI